MSDKIHWHFFPPGSQDAKRHDNHVECWCHPSVMAENDAARVWCHFPLWPEPERPMSSVERFLRWMIGR